MSFFDLVVCLSVLWHSYLSMLLSRHPSLALWPIDFAVWVISLLALRFVVAVFWVLAMYFCYVWTFLLRPFNFLACYLPVQDLTSYCFILTFFGFFQSVFFCFGFVAFLSHSIDMICRPDVSWYWVFFHWLYHDTVSSLTFVLLVMLRPIFRLLLLLFLQTCFHW